MPQPIDLSLNPAIDATSLARTYARTGRVQIAPFLADAAAAALYEHLRTRGDWLQMINSGETLYELSRATRASMADDRRQALDTAVYAGVRSGFQFRYEAIRVPDEPSARVASDDPLAALASWMSEGSVLSLLRTVTGVDAIDFADAQATAFAPGDMLTAHNDGVVGKRRHAAYVLGLTPGWRADWGGVLLFHDDALVTGGFVPAFNALNLFRVPQVHSVSEVTRAAPYRRYSVTGWLRSREPA